MRPVVSRLFHKDKTAAGDATAGAGCGPVSVPAGAEDLAVVFVPGVVESILLRDKGAPGESPYFGDAAAALKRNFGRLLVGSAKALFGRYDTLNKAAADVGEAAFGPLYLRPDGSSVLDLKTVIEGAAESSYAAIHRAGEWGRVGYGARMATEVAARLGGENVFVFCYDWRQGVVQVAEKLAGFLEDVKKVSGRENLALCGCSYGCQVIAQYLFAGGGDGVTRIVFNAPAWRGTALFRHITEPEPDKMRFNAAAAARVLTRFAGWELDLEPYAKLLPKRIVNQVAHAVTRRTLPGGLLYAAGLWSCCATEDYEEMKARHLDPVKSAALIAQTDAAHYGVMRRIPEVLAAAAQKGICLWVIMNDGTPQMAGEGIDGDGVIDAAGGSGGECLPLGKRFPEDHAGLRIDPAGRYDLSRAMLPDRTWVISGQVHGQSYWDAASRPLIADLLLTGKPATVDEDPAYPQFTDTRCPADGVSLRLPEGGPKVLPLSRGETRLTVCNDSEKKRVLVLSAKVRGLPCRAKVRPGLLRPGQTVPVRLIPTGGKIPCRGEVRIKYVKCDPLPLPHTRAFAFRGED